MKIDCMMILILICYDLGTQGCEAQGTQGGQGTQGQEGMMT
jgi:hypothetical protein